MKQVTETHTGVKWYNWHPKEKYTFPNTTIF